MKVRHYEFKSARDIIARAHNRAAACKRSHLSSREPEVGIFWFYEGKIFYQDSVPVSEGDVFSNYVNGGSDHFRVWGQLERSGVLKELPEELQEDYTSIPRGRVIYDQSKDVYTIFHGYDLGESELKKVKSAFRLPSGKVLDEVDMHYNSPDDIDWD